MKKLTNRISRISVLKIFLLAALFLTVSIDGKAMATVDTTFGTNGRIAITPANAGRVGGFVIQNNDKIIVAGDVSTNGGSNGVVRYNPDGTPDQSFGSGGKVVLSTIPSVLYAVAIQTDGKIVAVGSVYPTTGSSNTDFLIVRLNENGSLDSAFGSNGVVTVNQGSSDSLRAVKIQPDGKIVAVGGTSDLEGRGAVIRLNQNGIFDTSFSGGVVFIDLPAAFLKNENFYSIDFYANNRILLGGEYASGNGPGSRIGMITLLEPNGMLVQSFGENGFKWTGSIDVISSRTLVKILPDGTFVGGEFNPSRYTSEGTFISGFAYRRVTDIDFLSNGNYVVLSQLGYTPFRNGIGVLNKNFRFVGDDEKDTGISHDFSGTALGIQSNDKIIILRDGILLRLNGVTSYATRIANFDEDIYDRKTDPMVYRPSTRTMYRLSTLFGLLRYYQFDTEPNRIIAERSLFYWHAAPQPNSPGYFYANNASVQWGTNGDIAVGGDYDGDGLTDFTVFRPSTGVWYIRQSSNNQFRAVQFGQAGDRLVPADYDYDGITDFAVFRPSNGTWYVLRSSDNGFRAVQFGANGDVPAAGDYDGDGRADFVVFRPSNGVWYMLKSQEGFAAIPFGIATDQPVPGDYDGDGRHDAAVFRDGFWHLNQSRDGLKTIQWGLPGDIPISVRY